MQTEIVSIATLVPPKRNVRVHPEKQITELARAIERFGQTRPVVIDEDNVILAGNGLVQACQRLGHTEITAHRMTGLSAADKSKVMLSDNRIFSLGLDDHGAILDAIREFGEFDLDIPGFDTDTLKSLTLDTSSLTEFSLGDYGTLSDDAIEGARERGIRRGSGEADDQHAGAAEADATEADPENEEPENKEPEGTIQELERLRRIEQAALRVAQTLNGGFIVCGNCGDQESITDIDFADQLYAALGMAQEKP